MQALTMLVCLLCCAAPVCPAESFERLETERFVFYCRPQDKKAAQFLSGFAEAAADEASQILGFALRPRVDVYIVPGFSDFKQAFPDAPAAPSWAAGVAYPDRNCIVLMLRSRADLLKTFRHEVLHILLGQAFQGSNRVPRWLDEGLAMLLADEWSLSRLATMTRAALTGTLIPMEQLVESFPSELWNAELAYCQSFYFISFLKGTYSDEAFRAFLRNYSAYKDFHAALRSAYRRDWQDMEQQWRDYLKLRFSWIPLITSTSTLWFAATLLFLAGYLRKRRKSRRLLLQWEQEDAARGMGSKRGG